MRKLREFDMVRLLAPLSGEGLYHAVPCSLPAGAEGTIIEDYGMGYEVEFMLGEPGDPDWIVLAVSPEQVEPVLGAA